MQRSARIAVLAAVAAAAVVGFLVLRPDPGQRRDPVPTVSAPGRQSAPRASTPPVPPPVPVVTLRAGEPEGGVTRIEVPRGETLRFLVRSDRPGVVHVHGYDLEKAVAQGRPARFSFRATSDGVYEVEAHPSHRQIAELRVLP